ncbi:thioredoxin fold domain-containing protein [Vibrio breoganii]
MNTPQNNPDSTMSKLLKYKASLANQDIVKLLSVLVACGLFAYLFLVSPHQPPKNKNVNLSAEETAVSLSSNDVFSNLTIEEVRKVRDTNVVVVKTDGITLHYDWLNSTVISGTLYDLATGKNLTDETLNRPLTHDDYVNKDRRISALEAAIANKEGHNIATPKAAHQPKAADAAISESKIHQRLLEHSAGHKVEEEVISAPTELSRYDLANRINPKDLDVSRSHIIYKGTEFVKIGYSEDGKELPAAARRDQIQQLHSNILEIKDDFTISYEAENPIEHLIIWTDPTCPFCTKLHENMEEINGAGISVTYVFYPRALAQGLESPAANQTLELMNEAWYTKDRASAMDDIFAGYRVRDSEQLKDDEVTVHNPAFEHYFIGQILGIKGTPSMITSRGNFIQGWRDVATLVRQVRSQ